MIKITENTNLVAAGPYIEGHIDDFDYFYIPESKKGVYVVDKKIANTFRKCKNPTTLNQLADEACISSSELADNLENLLKSGMLICPDSESKLVDKRGRLQCWMHVTNTCNLSCDYCYIHKTPGNMTLETAISVVSKMLNSCREHDIHHLGIRFSGGEPMLMMNLIRQVVDYTNENRGNIEPHFSMITNGTLLNDVDIQYFKDNEFIIAVSIDGKQEFHDRHRHDHNGIGSYRRAIKGITRLRQAGIQPEILVTITSESMYGLPALTRELISQRLPFRFSLERDTGDINGSILSSASQLKVIIAECLDIMELAVRNGNTDFIFQFIDVHFDRVRLRSCAAGSTFFAIGHDGSLGTCGMGLQNPYGMLKEDVDLLSDLQKCNEDLYSLNINRIFMCSECIWKHSCAGGCPILTRAAYGTYQHSSPFCEIYKSVLPGVLHLHALRMLYSYKKERGERV